MRYTVRRGDTLGAIAQRTGTTIRQLVDLNPLLGDPDVIFPGQSIVVSRNGTGPDVEAAPARTYVVRSGDTLSALADHFGISVLELVAANDHIADPDVIFPGQLLSIPKTNGDLPAPPPPAGDGMPPWLALAVREMNTGVDEIPGTGHNQRIVEYHETTTLRATDDETPWCSSFVNWCIEQAGLAGTKSAAARSWLSWGRRLDVPRQGAVAVFSRPPSPTSGHVAFFWERAGDRVLVLGGNQSNQVNITGYPVGRLLAFRWPDTPD